ncbi:MAG: ABC transporter permease [Myxococcota bacterium]
MLLRIAFRNLVRSWRRSSVVISSIAVGLGASVFMVGLMKGMVQQMTDTAVRTRLGNVAVMARGYNADPDAGRNLPDGGRQVLAAMELRPGVAASARLRGEGLVQSARLSAPAILVGVDPRAERGVSSVPASIVEGSFLGEGSRARRPRELPPLVLGQRMARKLRARVGEKVVVHAPGKNGLGAFRIRGIFRTPSSEFDGLYVYLPLADLQYLLDVEGAVTEVALVLERPEEVGELKRFLEQRLAGSDVEILAWEEREQRLAALLGLMQNIYWIFYSAIFIAMGFGIANVLFMAVYERIREFGLLRAMGLRSSRLVEMVLLESLFLTLAGTAMGILLGLAIIATLGERGLDLAWFSEGLRAYGIGTSIRPLVEFDQLAWPVGVAAATGLVSGIFPALRAARLRPAEALRHI